MDQYVLDRCRSNSSYYDAGKFRPTYVPVGSTDLTPQGLESPSNSFDFRAAVNPAIVAAATSVLVTCLVIGIALTVFVSVRRRQRRNREVALRASASINEPTYSEAQSTTGLGSPYKKTLIPVDI